MSRIIDKGFHINLLYRKNNSNPFNLGLNQKNFLPGSKVTGAAINIGCTRGRGSTTRYAQFDHTMDISGKGLWSHTIYLL